MKILITGAHLTPAVAVIEELKRFKEVEIVYVGRKTTLEGDDSPSVESKVLPKMGIKFISLITGRLQRSFTPLTIPSLFKIPVGFIQALFIILKEKPQVILSFGGYVALPMVIIGWLFSVPIIIHEQTLVSGLANKINSLFADKIALAFDKGRALNKKQVLTGNPIRKNILDIKSMRHSGVNILVMGGNQGSHVINLTIESVLSELTKMAQIFHICGDNKFRDFERLKRRENDRYIVRKWLDNEYGEILQQADLVVSRAGINTLMELAYLGKPALVIPIPYLYQDEQNMNAKYFQKLGFVEILPQSQLTDESLLKNIKIMLRNLHQFTEKAKEAKSKVLKDAAKRLALETICLAEV